MAIFHSNFFKNIKGRIGNLIFYEVNGQQRVRTHKNKRAAPPNCSQILNRCRMRAAVSLYRANQGTEIPHIWKQEAKGMMMSGYNLFISANMPVFDQNHQISDYSRLHLSRGKLELPLQLEVTAYGNGQVSVCWQNILPDCSHRMVDFLHAVWLKTNGSFSLQTVVLPMITRAEEKADLSIAEAGKKSLHLYLYFSDRDGNCFSPDKYFFLKSKK